MAAGTAFRAAPGTAPFVRPGPSRAMTHPSHWLALMSALMTFGVLALLTSETHYLVGDPIANAVRFGAMSGLALMIAFRPRRLGALRKPRLFDGMAVMFCALAVTSVIYSADPSLTLLRAVSAVFLYAAVFWTLWYYADLVGDVRIADILIGCIAMVFVLSVVLLPTSSAWLSGRFRGVLANPNAIGMLTILFLPIAMARAMRTRKLSSYVLILIMLGCVVLSGSRNGVMTTSLTMGFFAIRIRAWRSALMLVALAAAAYLAMPDYNAPEGIAARPINHILSSDKLANGGGRLEAWQVAIPIIEDKILLGHGFGTEDRIFKGMTFRVHRGEYIHNSYLGLTYQLGLAGAALIFLPLLGLLIYRLMGHGFRSPQTAAYEAVLFGGLIASFFESWIYSAGNAFAFPFWTCVMLLTRAALGAGDKNAKPAPQPRATITRLSAPSRSLSPVSGPVPGLARVARLDQNAPRPNPKRFDPPPFNG